MCHRSERPTEARSLTMVIGLSRNRFLISRNIDVYLRKISAILHKIEINKKWKTVEKIWNERVKISQSLHHTVSVTTQNLNWIRLMDD